VQLAKAAGASPGAKLVKLADKLANVGGLWATSDGDTADSTHSTSTNTADVADSMNRCGTAVSVAIAPGAPASWSIEEVRGYTAWAMAVCRKLRGVNEWLDAQLDAIWQRCGISAATEAELEALLLRYYGCIEASD
jgi:hypothetical protein